MPIKILPYYSIDINIHKINIHIIKKHGCGVCKFAPLHRILISPNAF